ncbi:DUF1611 domain-containing protein [Methanopyrus sp.]
MKLPHEPGTPAIVLCHGVFDEPQGKTAHGLLRFGRVYDVVAVVDRELAGKTAQDVDPDFPPVPILRSVGEALEKLNPEVLLIGAAPPGGKLTSEWKGEIIKAVRAGLDVVSGLHEFLSEDPDIREAAEESGSRLIDVRKPRKELFRVADGSARDVDATVVLTAGTDCAVGKMSAAIELVEHLREEGVEAAFLATGQTGIMIGAEEGVVVDRMPGDFMAGAVEELVVRLAEDHEVVVVEGQGALSHPAYSGVTLAILHGAWPDAVVLVHDPFRESRDGFPRFRVPDPRTEAALVESMSAAEIVSVVLRTWDEKLAEELSPEGYIVERLGELRRTVDRVLEVHRMGR